MRIVPLINMLLTRLPFGVFLTSLALATSALPVHSVELQVLNQQNFDSTVANGVWFIEHFSPYCTHCKHFAPTWEKLVQHYESMDDPGVHLAQVNCATDGDLCNKHDVKGYPQMNLYKHGKFIEKFAGAREWDKLTEFLEKYTVPEQNASNLQTSANAKGVVLSLNPSNIDHVLEEGPTFIKFFAPWCGHCKKLAPIWTQLAGHMKGKLAIAEVDCEAHASICKQYDVGGYPSLAFFNGNHKTEYNSGRKLEQLIAFCEKAITPSVKEIKTEDELDEFVKDLPVIYLFLHSNSDSGALNQVKSASQLLVGSPHILTTSNPSIRTKFDIPPSLDSRPVLLALKDGMPSSFTSMFPFSEGATNKEDLSAWLLRNQLPGSLELSQDSFQMVMNAPHKPLVVIVATAATTGPEVIEIVQDAALTWRIRTHREERDVVFTWMDAEKWASWMKSMYGIKSSHLPAVVIADHQNLIYYDQDPRGQKIELTSDSILGTIDGVIGGIIKHKFSENFVERMARHFNNSLTSLEQLVMTHPLLTITFGIGIFAAFVVGVKKFINADLAPYQPNGHEYSKLQKSSGRLD